MIEITDCRAELWLQRAEESVAPDRASFGSRSRLRRMPGVLSFILGVLIAAPGFAQASEPVTIGVSGPLTGPNAQYGAQWKRGFDLALDEINGAGGYEGRKLTYDFEDTQSDPKQTVIVAQKFIADPSIVIELGDFSST